MTIKNLFGKQSNKIIASTNLEDVGTEVESADLLSAVIEDKKRFVPEVDYTDPANFAKYGSAEKYYTDSIKSIWKTYPYDGSFFEQTRWHNSSSDLTNYIFDKEYPRFNGSILLGRVYGTSATSSLSYEDTSDIEYIFIKGGPHTYITAANKKELFEKANKLKSTDNRGSNLELNGINGSTVEFFLNTPNLLGSPKQVIFDLWNSASADRSDYGRFKIEIRPGLAGQQHRFFIDYSSGSSRSYKRGVRNCIKHNWFVESLCGYSG